MSKRNFGRRKFFLIYAKLFAYTISNEESQTPSRIFFFLRGEGGCTQARSKRKKKTFKCALAMACAVQLFRLGITCTIQLMLKAKEADDQSESKILLEL